MNLHINKQDTQELFRYKQMVRFAAREQLCRSLQEKTRDLESQLAKEMKARLQHENRVAAASSKPSSSFAFSYQNPIVWTQKKAVTWTLQVEASIEGHN
ncbi:hypothetical protein IFM89_013953 [Coptis chinensis]|uniref:Uncharacterized protein n=1 Tax=Coptis chinensis TaxID=261450 RepID=A0A835LJ99_9MAGN|nr:hypothetical protein IFM89_013953 [Coptis chinensis]